jgi:hypothetical protein
MNDKPFLDFWISCVIGNKGRTDFSRIDRRQGGLQMDGWEKSADTTVKQGIDGVPAATPPAYLQGMTRSAKMQILVREGLWYKYQRRAPNILSCDIVLNKLEEVEGDTADGH